MDKIIRRCRECDAPQVVMRGGTEHFLRCDCEIRRTRLRIMNKTIHRQFLAQSKTMSDWKPSIFSREAADASGHPYVWRIMRAQRARAIKHLWEFCFKGDGEALIRSMGRGDHLYVRGPQHSGRGLITASIKMAAAMKHKKPSPIDDDFDVFRSEVMASREFGRNGEDARGLLSDKYMDVDLMVVENLRPEHTVLYSGEAAKAKFRGADEVDALIARRTSRHGSMLLTSRFFGGQIGTTLGERIVEELSSERTRIILLFSPEEAKNIIQALEATYESREAVFEAMKKAERAGDLQSRMVENENAVRVEDGFFLEDAFEDMPIAKAIQSTIETSPQDYPPAVLRRYQDFASEKGRDSIAFKRGVLDARRQVIMASPVCNAARLGQRPAYQMTPGEIDEAGAILAHACSGEQGLAGIEREAEEMLSLMNFDHERTARDG